MNATVRGLVKLPVSQLNGCVFCVDVHVGPPPMILAHDGGFVTTKPQNVPFGFGEGLRDRESRSRSQRLLLTLLAQRTVCDRARSTMREVPMSHLFLAPREPRSG
ncbi:hypothetical protein [Streptomyces sp. NPDC051219]|uniref:hypothetical protein n=1 Tax=Streptomyces sp. NPDC051219 TaxID=3155283 RepID=UPI00344A2D79